MKSLSPIVKDMRSLVLALFLMTPLGLISQEVVFKDLNIHASNKLLYSVEVPAPGTPGYTTAVLADLNTGEMEPLTFYPERAVFFSGLRTLQLQNRLGVYRRGATGTISVLQDEGFFQGESITQGKMMPLLASPDGQYLVYFEPKSVTRGDLYMKRVAGGEQIILSRDVPLSFDELPVLWGPDSRHLVYGHSGVVYYFSIAQWEEKRIPAQEFRILAEASLGAFKWSDDRELYFINGAQIYRILPEEFFTRSLYGGQFQVGGVVGKLPFKFDPYTDKFWISPSKDKLVVNWQGRFLFYYDLALPDFYSSNLVTSLPYLPLPQNMKVIRVLWSEGGLATILARSLEGTRTGSVIYRLGADIDSSQILFQGIDQKVIDLVGSPLSTNMAIVYENGVSVRRSLDFQERKFLNHSKTLGALWNNETGLYVLGEKSTLQADVANNTQRIVLLSQLDDVGFTEEGEVFGLLEGIYYRYDGEGRWSSRTEPPELMEPSTANDQFRVYTQAFTANYYSNQIMLRKNNGLGTDPLFTVLPDDYEPFPETDEPLSGDIFTHGTRIRNRVLSIVINAPDELDGLDLLLQSLSDYNFKVTFFLGGDFIRRHPGALKENSGRRS
jgi:hypothetical protein